MPFDVENATANDEAEEFKCSICLNYYETEDCASYGEEVCLNCYL